jgi:hypothetical protein
MYNVTYYVTNEFTVLYIPKRAESSDVVLPSSTAGLKFLVDCNQSVFYCHQVSSRLCGQGQWYKTFYVRNL